MRKLFTLTALAVFCVCSAARANDPAVPTKPLTAAPTMEQSTLIAQHVTNLGSTTWERSAKTLEQYFGSYALSTLMVAREYNTNATFRERCDLSIKQIEANIKQGLVGGQSKIEK